MSAWFLWLLGSRLAKTANSAGVRVRDFLDIRQRFGLASVEMSGTVRRRGARREGME